MRPSLSASMAASVSMRPPRLVLTIITPGLTSASVSRSTRWWVSAVSGAWRAMMSDSAKSSGRSTYRAPRPRISSLG